MNTIRLFISSPGDVAQEREICRRVIGRLNRKFGGRAHLDGYFWEYEPMVITKDYQEQIPPPSSFDIFVCILWSRLGSRLHSKYVLPDGRPCRSGTEFEFVDAVEGRKRTEGTPDILVWVNKTQPVIPLEPERDYEQRIEQWRSLKAFLDEWTRDSDEAVFTGAVNSYRQLDQFEERIEVKLQKLVERRLGNETSDVGPLPVQWTEGSPYLGLQAFGEAHEDIFFGRTAAIETMLHAVRRQAEANSGFVLILGTSGSGKSSLTYAGVLPMLTTPGVIEGIGLWRKASFRPGSDGKEMFANLAKALLEDQALPDLADPEMKEPVAELALRLEGDPGMVAERVRLVLNEAARQQREEQRQQMVERAKQLQAAGRTEDAEAIRKRTEELQAPRARLVLVMDQFEELFTSNASRDQQGQLVSAIDALSSSGRVIVLATLRTDFYHQCQDFPKLIALTGESGKVDLLPPQAHEIGQIIREPARMAGLRFEKDQATGASLDEAIRDAAMAHPDALPLLEHCLDQLYACQEKRGDRTLRFEDYEQVGKLEGALVRHAEDVYSSLDAEAQAAFDPVFRALVTLGRDEAIPVRRTALQSELQGKALIEKFTAQRLFTTDQNAAGHPTVCVAHEALLREWDRVQEWIAENEDFLAVRARVADAHARWKESSQDPSFLLQAGRQLAEAEEGIAGHEDSFASDERDFVRQSRLRINAAEEKAAKRRKLVMLGMAGLTSLAVVGFVLAQQQKERQEQTAMQEKQARERAEATLDAGSEFLTSVMGPDNWIMRLQDKDVRLVEEFLLAADDFAEQLSYHNPPEELRHHWMLAISILAKNYANQQRLEDAVKAQEQALAIQGQLLQLYPYNATYIRNLGVNHYSLGIYRAGAGDVDGAVQDYRQGLEVLEAKMGGEWLGDLAPTWLLLKAQLGSTLIGRTLVDEGKKHFEDALARIEVWKEEIDASSEIIQLALSQADAYAESAMQDEAASTMSRVDGYLAKVLDDDARLRLALHLAETWGRIEEERKNWPAAISNYESLLKQLPDDVSEMSSLERMTRMDVLNRLTEAQMNATRFEDAYESAYERAAITDKLIEQDAYNVAYVESHYVSTSLLGRAADTIPARRGDALHWYETGIADVIDLLLSTRHRLPGIALRLLKDMNRVATSRSQPEDLESVENILFASQDVMDALIDSVAAIEDPQAKSEAEKEFYLYQASLGLFLVDYQNTIEKGVDFLRAGIEGLEQVVGTPVPDDWKDLLRSSEEAMKAP